MKKLIGDLKCNKILISYNNEGIIKEAEFNEILKQFGNVKLYKMKYNRYKSNNNDQTANNVYEYLYFLDKTFLSAIMNFNLLYCVEKSSDCCITSPSLFS